MSLDLFDSAIRNADSEVAKAAAPDFPSTFSENFDTSLRYMTDWASAASTYHARTAALADYGDYVFRNTGERLPSIGVGESDVSIDEFNTAQAKLADQHPDLNLTPLSQADVDTMTRRRQAKAHDDFAALNGSRERTWGGTAGNVLGTLAGGFMDPIIVATLPLGGAGEVGIALRALEFAAIAGGATAASAAATYSAHEAAVPGSSKEIPGEIASAALFGAALGGGFGLLGKWLRAGEKPLPTSLREDVNAGASEAQFNATNVFDGAAGETANRDAVVATVDSILKGERVTAGETFFEAYHGSPHSFDEFDLSKIGTGEGAQSYGHGLYFAENEKVARGYQRATSDKNFVNKVAEIYDEGFSPDDAWSEIKSHWSEFTTAEQRLMTALEKDDWLGFDYPHQAVNSALRNIKAFDVSPETAEAARAMGNLYAVKITANKDHMLDWDKPLSEQSEFVRNALLNHLDPSISGTAEKHGAVSGRAFYERLMSRIEADRRPQPVGDLTADYNARIAGQRSARADTSAILQDAGIPGIKYLDQGSRDAGEGTRNFVVFDDKHVQIVSRNGEPLTIAQAHAIDAEVALRPLTHDVAPEAEAFDRIPLAHEDAATYWENRLAAAAPEERAALGATDAQAATFARDLAPEDIAKLAADPEADTAVLRNLDRVRLEKPDFDYAHEVLQPDGTTQIVTRKLEDVLDEIDGFERAGKELLACATGMMAAE